MTISEIIAAIRMLQAERDYYNSHRQDKGNSRETRTSLTEHIMTINQKISNLFALLPIS